MVSLDTLKEIVADMPSFITDEDLACYLKYANKVDGIIVDLGTGWGKSAVALALANPMNTVITLDNGAYPIYQQWASNIPEYSRKLNDIFKEKGAKNAF